MALFRDRKNEARATFFQQKDPDNGVNKAEFQK
jgi:hypothetical protein